MEPGEPSRQLPSTARSLSQVLQVNSLIQTQKSSELAAALLSVYLERADNLPVRAAPHGLRGPSSGSLGCECTL